MDEHQFSALSCTLILLRLISTRHISQSRSHLQVISIKFGSFRGRRTGGGSLAGGQYAQYIRYSGLRNKCHIIYGWWPAEFGFWILPILSRYFDITYQFRPLYAYTTLIPTATVGRPIPRWGAPQVGPQVGQGRNREVLRIPRWGSDEARVVSVEPQGVPRGGEPGATLLNTSSGLSLFVVFMPPRRKE